MSKKEVLIVGPNFYGYNESVAKAFQVKGFKTNIINSTRLIQGKNETITPKFVITDILVNLTNV